MPFLEHFDLADYPFGLTPNTALYYPDAHAEAVLASLEFSVRRGDGLLKVVGAVGSGKTMLGRMLAARLAPHAVQVAWLAATPHADSANLTAAVAREFGFKTKKGDDAGEVLRQGLIARHAEGFHNLLIVDEAQALGPEGLEAVRLLTNLETDTHKLLQILLLGQTELDRLLALPRLRQMAQRVSFAYMTRPLSESGVADYVRLRLERMRRAEAPARRALFEPMALRRMARQSGGLPRLVNLMADKALIAAYADGAEAVGDVHMRRGARETFAGMPWWRGWLPRLRAAA